MKIQLSMVLVWKSRMENNTFHGDRSLVLFRVYSGSRVFLLDVGNWDCRLNCNVSLFNGGFILSYWCRYCSCSCYQIHRESETCPFLKISLRIGKREQF